MIKLLFVAFMTSLLSASTMAHPGHGETEGFTITHYMVEPAHVIISASILLTIVIAVKWFKRKRKLL